MKNAFFTILKISLYIFKEITSKETVGTMF